LIDVAKINAAVEKELLVADRFYDNLCRVSGWRLAAVFKNARYCRDSLDKAFAINGHTGRWFLDLWVYVVNALPWFLPATVFLIPPLFYGLVNIVGGLLTYVTMEERIIETTVKVPFWFFFTTTKTITTTVLVPVTHVPDIRISTTIAGCIVLIGLILFSYITKALFQFELRWRRRLLMRYIARTTSPRN
jgi:hypothetical protein